MEKKYIVTLRIYNYDGRIRAIRDIRTLLLCGLVDAKRIVESAIPPGSVEEFVGDAAVIMSAEQVADMMTRYVDTEFVTIFKVECHTKALFSL